jgi:O-antigen/teichoic acid export membrane protein
MRAPSRSLSADAAVLALGSMVAQGALVINLSVLARIVPKTQIATYQQLNLLYGIVSPLFLGGVPAALLYFIPRAADPEERARWVMRAYLILSGMGAVAVIGAIAFRGVLATAFSNPGLEHALVLYAPFLFCAFVSAVGPPALVACRRPRAAAVLNAALGIAIFTASVVAAVISPTGSSLALGLTIAGATLAVCSVTLVWRTVKLRLGDPWRTNGMREILVYGLPLALTGVAGTLGFQLDRIVVGSQFSPATFAIYALGAVEIPIGLLIGQAVTNVLVPILTLRWRDGDRAGMVAVWRAAMAKTSTVLFPLFTFLMAMSADVIRTLYGAGYSGSLTVFRIYLFLIPMRVATWGLIPQAIGRTRINLAASLVILIANAVVAILLVGPLGIVGAALAGPTSTLVAAAFYLVRLRPLTGFRIRDLVPIRSMSVTFVIAVVCALPLLLIQRVGDPSVLRLAGGAVAFTILIVPALRVAGQISDADWARATSWTHVLSRR